MSWAVSGYRRESSVFLNYICLSYKALELFVYSNSERDSIPV